MTEQKSIEANESTIADLERQKLQLELVQLRRPWYLKPGYLGGVLLPLILALFTLFKVWTTGYFDSLRINLESQKQQLSASVDSLNRVRDSLIFQLKYTEDIMGQILTEKDSITIEYLRFQALAKTLSNDRSSRSSIFRRLQSGSRSNYNLNYRIGETFFDLAEHFEKRDTSKLSLTPTLITSSLREYISAEYANSSSPYYLSPSLFYLNKDLEHIGKLYILKTPYSKEISIAWFQFMKNYLRTLRGYNQKELIILRDIFRDMEISDSTQVGT